MKSRRSAGRPEGRAWPFVVQPCSSSLTAVTSPRSMTAPITWSAVSSHTSHGGVSPPSPATDWLPAHDQLGRYRLAPSAAPAPSRPRLVIVLWLLSRAPIALSLLVDFVYMAGWESPSQASSS